MLSSTPRIPQLLLSTLLILQQPFLSSAGYNAKACNNSPHLCNVPYGSITYLGTHNSPFLRDRSTSFSTSGNQYFNVTVQLDAGVRFLQGQLHKDSNGGEPRLCHSSCSLMDGGTLSRWLGEIKDWMDEHASEVVTILIVNEDKLSATELLPSFKDSETDSLAFVPSTDMTVRTFPTLQNMIKEDKRLVVFVTSGGGDSAAPFLLNEWDHIWETKWENTDPNAWSCAVDRPGRLRDVEGVQRAEQEGVVPLLNWFLYVDMGLGIMRPYVEVIADTNDMTLAAGLANCSRSDAWKALPPPRAPTFVLVDFFNEGNPIAHIDKINNVTEPVNRVAPPPTPKANDAQNKDGGSGSSAGEQSLNQLLYQIDNNGLEPTWADWILASGDWGSWVDWSKLGGKRRR